jgi:hypothetical protein
MIERILKNERILKIARILKEPWATNAAGRAGPCPLEKTGQLIDS